MGITLSSMAVASIYLYGFCYYGKLATDSFEKMADSLYMSNWMRFPIHLQKHLILIIQNSRRPIEYQGFFAVFTVNLETFTKVILKWIYSTIFLKPFLWF